MEQNKHEAIVVLVTASSPDEATRIAEALVKDRVVACVNVIPGITSIFRWEGKIEHSNESLMICKTTLSNFEELKELVQRHHSYDTPEIVAIPASAVEDKYMNWLTEAVR